MVRVENRESIRNKIYRLWVDNPYITAMKACEKLSKNSTEAKIYYRQHGNYINKLLSDFRSYHKFGLPQKALNPHMRVFVWENMPRELLPGWNVARSLKFRGWREVANRNQMWIFRDEARGSVHWYKNGTVRMYLQGSVKLARVKELFCRAFSWFTPEQWTKYLDVPLREESRHWVFDVGAPMPRFDIRKFEKTHGVRIFTDGSHPTSLEVEETRPLSLIQFEETLKIFGEDIAEHRALILEWQKEARGRRREKGLLRRFFEWLI